MTKRFLALPLIGIALLFTLPVCADQPDPADDPLPKYANFLAPTMAGGIRRYDIGTGRPLEEKGTFIVDPGHVVVSADGKRAAVARPGSFNVVKVETGELILAASPRRQRPDLRSAGHQRHHVGPHPAGE